MSPFWGLCPKCGRPCVAAPDLELECPEPPLPEYSGALKLGKEFTLLGNRFRRYVAPDGRWTDVKVRAGYDGPGLWTNADAKRLARQQLAA